MEPPQKQRRENRVSAKPYVKCAIARFFETMRRIAVGCVYRYLMAAVLEGERHVDDEALGAADAEVGVDYDDVRSWDETHLGGMGLLPH